MDHEQARAVKSEYTSVGGDLRPVTGPRASAPVAARNPGDLIVAMLRLKRWCGLSYRRLERLAADAGEILPRSTLEGTFSRGRLPRPELVAAFTRACGCGEREIAEWVAVCRRLSADNGL